MATCFCGGSFFGGDFFFDSSSAPEQSGGPVPVVYFKRRLKDIEEERREEWAKRQTPEEISQELLGVIKTVAVRQVQNLGLDKHQQFEELERELEALEVTWDARYLEALNLERERLIDAEIGERLKAIKDEDEAMLLILLGAYV